MTRIVVVLEPKLWPPWRGRGGFDRLVARLRDHYRFMPDTQERLGPDVVEIPFPRRKDIDEARREVVRALDGIDPQWMRHLSMINERTARVRGGAKQ